MVASTGVWTRGLGISPQIRGTSGVTLLPTEPSVIQDRHSNACSCVWINYQYSEEFGMGEVYALDVCP